MDRYKIALLKPFACCAYKSQQQTECILHNYENVFFFLLFFFNFVAVTCLLHEEHKDNAVIKCLAVNKICMEKYFAIISYEHVLTLLYGALTCEV